jgi:phosphatidylinositol dimannoside acyltransferase
MSDDLRPPVSEQVLDVLRWAHLNVIVPMVPADRPGALRWMGAALNPLYRRSFGMRHHPILSEEFDRCSGGAFDHGDREQMIRDTFAMQVRVNLEEAALPRLDREDLGRVCTVAGSEHIDAALQRGRGVIMAFLHFGQHWYLPVWCGHNGYLWNQVAAAGRPPEDKWQPSWFGRQVFDARDAWFDALPVNFMPLDTPNRVLIRALKRNELVGLAVDGRIGTKFETVRFLGREALFSPGATKLSRISGAPIVPCNTVARPDGRQQVTFLEPLDPPSRKDAIGDAVQQLVDRLEPFVLAHPDHYGSWLHHVRRHQGWDDHPFFLDHRG